MKFQASENTKQENKIMCYNEGRADGSKKETDIVILSSHQNLLEYRPTGLL